MQVNITFDMKTKLATLQHPKKNNTKLKTRK